MKKNNKINCAVIGSGVGLKHADILIKNKSCKLKYICELDKNKIKLLKLKYPNISIIQNEDLIFKDKDINLVSLASYDHHHFKQIVKSIKFKKKIIVEKPICTNEFELNLLEKLIKKNKVKITSNLVLRSTSIFKRFKKEISKLNLKPYYIELDYLWGRFHKLLQWRSKSKNYSIINGAAIHMIDLILWLINEKPIFVSTYANKMHIKKNIFNKPSFILIILRYRNGLIVKLTANANGPTPHFHSVKIFSHNKTMINSFNFKKIFVKKNDFLRTVDLKEKYPDKLNRKEIINSFIESINDPQKKPIVDRKDLFDTMRICLSAEKSLKEKKEIKIKYK
jgi:predicted dehydrogenase